MIKFILKNRVWLIINAWWISGVLCWISQLADSLGDAMIFTGWKNSFKRDFLWHVIKYIPEKLGLFFSGVFAAGLLYQLLVDFWHFQTVFVLWAILVGLSFAGHHFHYKFWKNKLKGA